MNSLNSETTLNSTGMDNLTELESVAPSVVEDMTTLIADDNAPIVSSADPVYQSDQIADEMHTIQNMLARESDLGSYPFDPNSTTNQTPAQFTYTVFPPIFELRPINSLIFSQFINDRVKNFRYFSYSHINIKLKWNVNPFVTGKIGLFWTPDGLDLSQLSLAMLTGYPGMIADLNNSSSLEIQIPWTYPTKALNLNMATATVFSNVRACCRVMLPVEAASPPNLSFRVYAQFVDPKLFGPSVFRLAYRNLYQKQLGTVDEDEGEAVAQVNVDVKESNQAAKTGVVSNILNKGADFAGSLSQVPYIGKFAGIASTVAGFLGKAAEAFGFSKHFNVTPLTKLLNMPEYGWNNADGDDISPALGLLRQPAIDHGSYAWATDKDEMTVSYIGEKEVVVDTLTWSEDQAPNTIIKFIDISVTGLTGGTPLTYAYTPGEYVAAQFKYARFKSIIYRFDFAKTPFHNGVLEVGVSYTTTSNIPDDSQQVLYTMVVDVLNRKEFEVEIPFMYNRQWIQPNLRFGTIYLKVISPLISNPNVPNQINCLISKRFEGLTVSNFWQSTRVEPVNVVFQGIDVEQLPIVIPVPTENNENDEEIAVAQINLAVNTDSVRLVAGKPLEVSSEIPACTTGDVCLSIRKLLKCFWRLEWPADTATVKRGQVDLDHINVFARTPVINYFSKLFFFYRGGVRLKFSDMQTDPSDQGSAVAALRFSLGPLQFRTGGPSHYVLSSLYNKILQCVLPYYGEVPYRFVRPTAVDSSSFNELNGAIPCITYTNNNARSATTNKYFRPVIYSALGEDFSFFGLHGAPLFTRQNISNKQSQTWYYGMDLSRGDIFTNPTVTTPFSNPIEDNTEQDESH